MNRYLAGIEKEWIDNKGKKLTDIKDLIGRSKHTAVISLVGYSSGNNPISAWYETQNEKYYATDLKKPCYLWHTKEKLLVYDQETKSIYFLNNDEKNPREGDRFSQISDKEIILKGVHNPYTEDNRIILEIEFSLWDDQSFGIQKCAFIYDFWPEKTFGEKYEATLIGIEETYIKDKYNLSAHKLGEIISNVNEENANRKDISWNIHPYISLGQYGFYFIEEKTFALPGENSRRQNLLPLGIIKNLNPKKIYLYSVEKTAKRSFTSMRRIIFPSTQIKLNTVLPQKKSIDKKMPCTSKKKMK